MQIKTTKIIYWILLGLFSAFFLVDAIGGLMRVEAGIEAMQQLGYALYIMTLISITKILGVVGLWQNKFPTLKEWAFAGFTINFIGASASWYFSGGPTMNIFFPLITLVLLFAIYGLWKKLQMNQTNV